jgi:hypothetical protein
VIGKERQLSKPESLALLIAAILYAAAWSMAAAGRRP